MDELKAQIAECCAGMTAEEIEQEIRSSIYADAIADPAALAAYFAQLASA